MQKIKLSTSLKQKSIKNNLIYGYEGGVCCYKTPKTVFSDGSYYCHHQENKICGYQ